MIPDKLLVKAFEKLDPLEVGEKVTPDDVKNWDVFVNCAKIYQDTHGTLLLSNDYTKIKKVLSFKEQIELFENKN